MRVIEPHQLQRPKRRKINYKLLVVISLMVGLAGYILMKDKTPSLQKTEPKQTVTTSHASDGSSSVEKSGQLKQFSGQEFKDLYYSVAYPNLQQVTEPFAITGNLSADQRIRRMAEERGYKTTGIPQGSIVKINEPRLNGDDLLQPLAAQGWQSLKIAAAKDNIPLSIISAYRSPEWQRKLFTERLFEYGILASQIADGTADSAVSATLSTAAVPGYSRHHTGYTIDLWCEDGSGAFVNSVCYSWIQKDNYLKAKENGWIPSYPEGTDLQGPEPEPWEYVWVGVDNLR